jgi:hypothetical protein
MTESLKIQDIVVKPNATKHTCVSGKHKNVDSILVEILLKKVYFEVIFFDRVENLFPFSISLATQCMRVCTNSQTTSNIKDPECFRETVCEIVRNQFELIHYFRHNDFDRYRAHREREKSLPKMEIKLSKDGVSFPAGFLGIDILF